MLDKHYQSQFKADIKIRKSLGTRLQERPEQSDDDEPMQECECVGAKKGNPIWTVVRHFSGSCE